MPLSHRSPLSYVSVKQGCILFYSDHYVELEDLTGWVWKAPELSSWDIFCFRGKIVLDLLQILTKILQTWMFIAHFFLMLEKNVDHPHLHRFSPDGWIVLRKILMWYDATLDLVFISIWISYRYSMKICKLLHFRLVKGGFSFLLVIFLFKI